MACLPTYKGKRFKSLADIAQEIKQTKIRPDESNPLIAEAAGDIQPTVPKIMSPDLQKPSEHLDIFGIDSNSYKESVGYNNYLRLNADENQDLVMKKLNAKPGEDPVKVLEDNIEITGQGLANAKDGDIALFTDPNGQMISYGMVSVDSATGKQYYVSYDPSTKKQNIINLGKAQEVYGNGYTARLKEDPEQPAYVSPEEWQKAIQLSKAQTKFSEWKYNSMTPEERAQYQQQNDQMRKDGIAFGEDSVPPYTPSNKWWWFKSGINNSLIGKAYQLLNWHNIKEGLLLDVMEDVADAITLPSGELFKDPVTGKYTTENPNPPKKKERNYIINDPIFEIGEYQPSFVEEVVSGAFSITADLPLFLLYGKKGAKMGAKAGQKYLQYFTKRTNIKYGAKMVDDLVATGISRPIAERTVATGLAKANMKAKAIGSKFGSNMTALGVYDFQNDLLTQVIDNGGNWDDIDYAHSLEEGAIGATLGVGLSFMGLGSEYLNRVLTNPSMTKVEKQMIKVGVGAVSLPLEAGMFVYGKQGLQGKPLSDITARDYGVMLGTLGVLKAQGAIQKGGKTVFEKSKTWTMENFNPNKIELTPLEIEYLNQRRNYGSTSNEVFNNLVKTHGKIDPESKRISSLEISDIMADPNVPIVTKNKLIFVLGGYKANFEPELSQVNVVSKDGKHYVETRTTNGDLWNVMEAKNIGEANEFVNKISATIVDVQRHNKFANLPEMDKAMILTRIKGSGGNVEALQEAWSIQTNFRSPDQNKMMEQLYTETDKWVAEKEKAAEKAAKEAEKAKESELEKKPEAKVEEPEVKVPEPKPEDVKPVEEKKPEESGQPLKPQTNEQIQQAGQEIAQVPEPPKAQTEKQTIDKTRDEIIQDVLSSKLSEKNQWELTRDEFAEMKWQQKVRANLKLRELELENEVIEWLDRDLDKLIRDKEIIKQEALNDGEGHDGYIHRMLSAGIPVPEKVLNEYPELKKEYGKKEPVAKDDEVKPQAQPEKKTEGQSTLDDFIVDGKKPWEMTSQEMRDFEKDYDKKNKDKRFKERKLKKKDVLDDDGTIKNFVEYVKDSYDHSFSVSRSGKRVITYTVVDNYPKRTGFYSPQPSFTSKNIDDVINWMNEQIKKNSDIGTYYAFDGINHRVFVERAINEGRPVPERVLNEYPELKEKTKPPKPTETKEEKTESSSLLEGKEKEFNDILKAQKPSDAQYYRVKIIDGGTEYYYDPNSKEFVKMQFSGKFTPDASSTQIPITKAEETELYDGVRKGRVQIELEPKTTAESAGMKRKVLLKPSTEKERVDYDVEKEKTKKANKILDWSYNANIDRKASPKLGDQLHSELLDALSEYEAAIYNNANAPSKERQQIELEAKKAFDIAYEKALPLYSKEKMAESLPGENEIISDVIGQKKWSHPVNRLEMDDVRMLLKNKDKEQFEDYSEELEITGYIKQREVSGNDIIYDITPKGRELIEAIEARKETVRGLKEGWDLFPQDADPSLLNKFKKTDTPIEKTPEEKTLEYDDNIRKQSEEPAPEPISTNKTKEDPIEITKKESKLEDVPNDVIKNEKVKYEEFLEKNNFAIAQDEIGFVGTIHMPKDKGYDAWNNDKARFYDVSGADIIESGSGQAKKILLETLKEKGLDEHSRMAIESAIQKGGILTPKLINDVIAIKYVANRLGYDGIRLYDTSALIWNKDAVSDLGFVKDVRQTILSGQQWKDPRFADLPEGDFIESGQVKKPSADKPKSYKPMTDKERVKLLNKLAGKKSSISITNEVYVKDGVATVTDLENTIRVKTSLADGMYKIVGEDFVKTKTDPSEFPTNLDVNTKPAPGGKMVESKVVEIELKDVVGELKKALPFVGHNELRPIMNAVNLRSDGNNLYIASTDAHRLFVKKIPVKLPEFNVNLPESAIKLLLSNPTLDTFKMRIGELRSEVETRDFVLNTRNVDGKYPNYEAVFPNKTYQHLTFDKGELITLLDKLLPYADKGERNQVDITFDKETGEVSFHVWNESKGLDKTLKLKAKDIQFGMAEVNQNESRLLMPKSVEEKATNRMGMNAQFLRDVVNSIDGDVVTLHNSVKPTSMSSNRAFVIDDGKSTRIEKEKKPDPIRIISEKTHTSMMDEFRKNFSSVQNVSDVVGGKDATKFMRSDGFSMILDPSSTGMRIESIYTPPEKRNQQIARIHLNELAKLADKHNIPLTLRVAPEVVEGKEVVSKDRLKEFYEDLGFVFQGDEGVRLPKTQNKNNTAPKNTKGKKGLFANEGDILAPQSSGEGKKPEGDQPGKKVTMEDADIVIPEHWSKDVKPDEVFKAIDFPEMVEIVHQMIGRYPQPKNMRNTRALGYFRPSVDNPMIALKRALFYEANYEALKYVLAHEIGHLNDWFPDKDMRRGNILGRISSGRSYLSNTLGEKPGKTNILTTKDRERLRNEARKTVREESKKSEQQIIEEIVKEIPVFDEAGMNANDVAAIWRDIAARDKYPELYDYISRLTAEQKKQIMKEALQGVVNSDIARKFKKQIGTTTTIEQKVRMIRPMANTAENIRKMYQKLLMEEINKRKLFDKETIIKELMDVTRDWRRYDPATASKDERKYRESPEELYADAFALLMNNPERLQKVAPVFYNAFFSWWDAKSGSKQYFDEIQNLLRGGDGTGNPPGLSEATGDSPLEQHRLNRLFDGYKEGERKRSEIADRKNESSLGFWGHFKREFLSVASPLMSIKRDVPKKLGPDFNKQQEVENEVQMRYFTRDKVGELLVDINTMIEKPLAEAGLDPYEFAALMEMERNITQYKDKARPGGMQTDASTTMKEFINKRYTPEQAQAMQNIIQDFHDLVYRTMDYANQNGIFTPDQWQMITENKDVYVTYSKVKHIHENYITSKIIEAEGSLEKNESPFVATTLKVASTFKAAERNRAALAVVKDMVDNAPNEIKIVDPTYIRNSKGEVKEIIPKPEQGNDHIVFFENGKKRLAEVDKYIADIFNNPDSRNMMQSLTGIFKKYNSVFKPLVTSLNMGWAFYNNPIRDANRSLRGLTTILFSTEGVSKRYAATVLPRFMEGYAKQLLYNNSEAKNYVRNKLDPAIREMIENGAITKGFFGSYDPFVSDQLEPIFKQHGFIGKEKTLKEKIMDSNVFTKSIGYMVNRMLFAASVIEATPKIVSYDIMKKAGISEKLAGYYTRNYIGTPFYYQKGKFTHISNEFLPFSNVILQGMAADLRLATAPQTRKAYHTYQIATQSSLALLTAGAAAGLFGDTLKKWYDMVDDYIKYNYFIIPLGFDDEGRPKMITIPQDELGRLAYSSTLALANTVFKATNGDLKGFKNYWDQFKQVKQIGTGFVPSISPLAEIVGGIYSYFMQDRNPVDSFTGKEVIPEKKFKAGMEYSAPELAKWSITKSGGRWIIKLIEKDPKTDSWTEYIMKNAPVLNRAYRVGGTGAYQMYSKVAGEVETRRNVELLTMDRIVNDAVIEAKKNNDDYFSVMKYIEGMTNKYFGENNYDPNNKDQLRDLRSMEEKFRVRMLRGFETPIDQLYSAMIDRGTTKEGKIAILKKAEEYYPSEEFDDILMDMVFNGIISKGVYSDMFLETHPEIKEAIKKMEVKKTPIE